MDSQAVRILIVDDNPVTIENVARLLDFEPGLEVVGTAKNGREGVQRARELRPNVVLMDINMPDMDGIEACRQIGQSSPASRVMMMSVQSDLAYFKQAMNAGAREFLIKPFDYDELVNAIRRVNAADPTPIELAALAAPAPAVGADGQAVGAVKLTRGVLLAVFGAKGGVGCSTIASNLAIVIHKSREADVLLIDGDVYFGVLDALLDLQPSHRLLGLLDVFDPEDQVMMLRMMTAHSSGISVLAGPERPELGELVQPEDFLAMLETLCQWHDYVVVDLGSSYNSITQPVLDLADRVILTLTPAITAVKNTHLLLNTASMKTYSLEKVIPLLNKFNSNWGITAEAVGNAIGRPVDLVIKADRASAVAAANRGTPLIFHAPRSPVTKSLIDLEKLVPDIGKLADELTEAARRKDESAPPPIVSTARGQDQGELDWSFAQDRQGCARWIPFLGRFRAQE